MLMIRFLIPAVSNNFTQPRHPLLFLFLSDVLEEVYFLEQLSREQIRDNASADCLARVYLSLPAATTLFFHLNNF